MSVFVNIDRQALSLISAVFIRVRADFAMNVYNIRPISDSEVNGWELKSLYDNLVYIGVLACKAAGLVSQFGLTIDPVCGRLRCFLHVAKQAGRMLPNYFLLVFVSALVVFGLL